MGPGGDELLRKLTGNGLRDFDYTVDMYKVWN